MSEQDIFISYRRDDSRYAALFLHKELVARFGEESVFFDRGIAPGRNYVQVLRSAAGSCKALVALIGPGWLEMKGDDGGRRLDREDDWVRIEIATALARGALVIPVLLNDTERPGKARLPADIGDLDVMQEIRLRDDDVYSGVRRLLAAIETGLGMAAHPDGPDDTAAHVADLLSRARLLKSEADQMYFREVGKAGKAQFGDAGTAEVDLSDMLAGFDEEAHTRKLEEAYDLARQANELEPANTAVLLLMAELLMELTPDDPTDEQELLYRVKSLISAPDNDTQRFHLAKATFLLAVSGDDVHADSLRDARDTFESLGRQEWVRQCDDILRGLTSAPQTAAPPAPPPQPAGPQQPGAWPNAFNPVGNWLIRDSAYVASAWTMQMYPNGTFQGWQQTPALGIQAPCQGQWAFDPAQSLLHVQGIVNNTMPFGTAIHIQGQSPEGWYGTGIDGTGYMLTPQ